MASLPRSDFISSFPLCSDFEAAGKTGKTRGIAEMGTKLSAAISAATTEPRSKHIKTRGKRDEKIKPHVRCAKRVKSTPPGKTCFMFRSWKKHPLTVSKAQLASKNQ